MMWHSERGRDFEVNWNCKKLPCSLANGPQRIRKEVTARRLMLLCIGCTSVVQCERTVVLQSTEMRNFSAAECGKAIRGNLQNVSQLIFRKLPLDNFPHSTFRKILAPVCIIIGFRLWLAHIRRLSAPADSRLSALVRLGRFGFSNSVRFGFQSQVLGFVFFRFRYLHTTTMQEYTSVWKH